MDMFDMKPEHLKILTQFGKSVVATTHPENVLVVTNFAPRDPMPPDLFPDIPSDIKKGFLDLTFDEGHFDLILGTLPIALKAKKLGTTVFETSFFSWEVIFKLSNNLTESGFGIFLIGPLGFGGYQGKRFQERMNSNGVFVHGYINLPEGLLKPATSIRPLFVITSKQNTNLRVCSLSSETNFDQLSTDLLNANESTQNIDVIHHDDFNGFYSIEIRKQINRLETRYKDYRTLNFGELVENSVMGKKDQYFEEKDNCVYLNLLGNNSNLITDLDEVSGRRDNFLQIQLKDSISNNFLKIFFQSTLGELILKSAVSGISLPRLNRNYLFELEIPVPDISVQKQVVETRDRLNRLESEIEQFKKQISLNPISSDILLKIDSMLDTSSALSEEEKIKTLVLQGESGTLEFKQTFQHCLKTLKKEDYVETSSLKTVAAFLNMTGGGTLLVGVEDSGLIPGIDFELGKYHRNSNDRFLRHLKDKIKSRLGMVTFNFITEKLVKVDGKTVLKIDCKPSDQEVFLDDKDFYIRTSPSTEKLEGRARSSYVKSRFH